MGKITKTRLRKSITPGTVLILLAGHFRAKRVVFLKQLESGCLLVTGPYKINGVPLRRVNQAYVIATSTKVDVSGVDVSAISDATFAREVKEKTKKDFIDGVEEEEKEKKAVSPAKKEMQANVDNSVIKAIETVPQMAAYLKAKFSLTRNQRPHEMVF